MSQDKEIQIIDQDSMKLYRTEIPNVVDDMDLNVYEFRLYVHLKRVTGANGGLCWQSTRTLADACKMSTFMVSSAKKGLEKKKLIKISRANKQLGDTDKITIIDIWADNFTHFKTLQGVSINNNPVITANRPVIQANTGVIGNNERKNSSKKELKEEEKELHVERPKTPPDGAPVLASPSPEEKPPVTTSEVRAERRDINTTVLAIFAYWQQVRKHPDAKLTDGRRAKITARLKDGYTETDIKLAIDGCNNSPHHTGTNDTGTVYDDLTLICRSGEKLEMFKAKAPAAARKAAQPTQPQQPEKPPLTIHEIRAKMEAQEAREEDERRKGLRI